MPSIPSFTTSHALSTGAKGSRILAALLGGGVIGTGINKKFDLSGKIAKMLRPDPSMPTKEQNDESMDLMKMLMSPETQLKYLKNTGQGYPADEEMFLNSERENTNDMLLRLLREQNIEE